MTEDESPRTQEEALCFALAINRGMQLMDPKSRTGAALADKFKDLYSPATAVAIDSVNALYQFIHDELFRDWKTQEHLHPPHKNGSQEARQQLRDAIHDLLDVSLLTSTRFAKTQKPEELAKALATFYQKASRIQAFDYGNRLTLDLFMAALLNQPHFTEVEGFQGGLDFRRLNEKEKKALRASGTNLHDLTKIFAKAINPRLRPPSPKNTEDPKKSFFPWPRNQIKIGGLLFLGQEVEGEPYVVTITGGLVPKAVAKEKLEAFLTKDLPLAEFSISAEAITSYLAGTEALRIPGKTHIDGIPLPQDGSVPLFCLETDILTGLRQDKSAFEAIYKKALKKHGLPEDEPIFTLANNGELYQKLLAETTEGTRLHRATEMAYANVSAIVDRMNESKRRIIDGKTPPEKTRPKFYMSMGGASAGKTTIEQLAAAECGYVKNAEGEDVPNYVKASLDDFRNESELYQVMKAANHHADDYKVVEAMANNLRTWVTDAAREKGLNVFYDGTGIDYEGRYDKIVKKFKEDEHRYDTRLGAVDAWLEKAVERVKKRFDEKQRALPWTVVTGKHIDFPYSLMAAMVDPHLDKISVFCNDTKKEDRYLMAESFSLKPADTEVVATAKADGKLAETFGKLLDRKGYFLSTLPLMLEGSVETPETIENRRPKLSEKNVAYFAFPQGGNTRVFAIYDLARFTELIKKGQKNKYANTLKDLEIQPSAARFVIRP